MTTTKESPIPKVRVRDAIDVNVTLLLSLLDEGCRELQFNINRKHADCRTPRRNPDVVSALVLMSNLELWAERIGSYLRNDVFVLQNDHGLDVGSANDDTVFVPAIPIFNSASNSLKDEDNNFQGLLVVLAPRSTTSASLSVSDQSRFLSEQKRTLAEKLTDLAKVFPDGVKLVTGYNIVEFFFFFEIFGVDKVAEANIIVATAHIQRISHFLEAGLCYSFFLFFFLIFFYVKFSFLKKVNTKMFSF
jgi:hypothetical protein